MSLNYFIVQLLANCDRFLWEKEFSFAFFMLTIYLLNIVMNITANNKQFCSMELLSERKIDSYLTYYRNLFDNERVMKLLPKMHFLEDHLLEWIKRYKVGMGLHGEQGGESLHATFNNLNRLHWNQ